MKVTTKWNGQMAFTGKSPSGHEIIMDAAEKSGGSNTGARPTELLLQATAGCTGIDIVSILSKMRFNIDSFEMEVEGARAEEYPQRFTGIHIHYSLEGELPEDKVVRAIKLSKDKYCSVSNSLNAEITVSYSINGAERKQL